MVIDMERVMEKAMITEEAIAERERSFCESPAAVTSFLDRPGRSRRWKQAGIIQPMA